MRALAGLLAVALSGGAALGDSVEEKAARALKKGIELLEAARPADAEVQFRKAVDLVPEKGAPHFWLGKALVAQGRCREAVRELELYLERSVKGELRGQAREMIDLCKQPAEPVPEEPPPATAPAPTLASAQPPAPAAAAPLVAVAPAPEVEVRASPEAAPPPRLTVDAALGYGRADAFDEERGRFQMTAWTPIVDLRVRVAGPWDLGAVIPLVAGTGTADGQPDPGTVVRPGNPFLSVGRSGAARGVLRVHAALGVAVPVYEDTGTVTDQAFRLAIAMHAGREAWLWHNGRAALVFPVSLERQSGPWATFFLDSAAMVSVPVHGGEGTEPGLQFVGGARLGRKGLSAGVAVHAVVNGLLLDEGKSGLGLAGLARFAFGLGFVEIAVDVGATGALGSFGPDGERALGFHLRSGLHL
jgi:hypothetical protein